jgi:hypothetical protein
MLRLHIYCLSVSFLSYKILVFSFVIFHCTYTQNNCAWLSNCCSILCIFHISACGNSVWYIHTIWHVALCVSVYVWIVLWQDTRHTTYTLCMVYGLRQHCTIHSAYLPCLLLKRNSYVCSFAYTFQLLPNLSVSYKSRRWLIQTYHKTLCQKQSWITNWLELLENNGRGKHKAIGYLTSTDVYQDITRKIISKWNFKKEECGLYLLGSGYGPVGST